MEHVYGADSKTALEMNPRASSRITELIQSISEYDSSIFYDPPKFAGFIRDYYVGNKLVSSDFIQILDKFRDEISNCALKSHDLSSICLEGANDVERAGIQTELFQIIYIRKKIRDLSSLNQRILDVYGQSAEEVKQVEEVAPESPIISFSRNGEHVVEYGQLIKFVWTCKNPHRLCLSNGQEKMDVTHLDSLVVSAIFDCYELILYDEEGKAVDKKTITIRYRKKVYCINCGSLCYDANQDLYCTECGVRIFYGN